MRVLVLVGIGLFTGVPQLVAEDLQAAKRAVDDLGLSVSGTYIVPPGELTLAKNVTQFGTLKRDITATGRKLALMEKQYAQFEQQFTQAQQQLVTLNAQLANANPNDVFVYNRIVGAVNALTGQVDLMYQQRSKMDEQLAATKAEFSKGRESYVQLILDTRILVEETTAKYEELAQDENVTSAIAAYAKAARRDYKLGPSTTFAANVKKLEGLEGTLESDTITLVDAGSNTFHVAVIVNGKHQEQMVVDSGASFVSLPFAMAQKLGIKVNEEEDETITLKIANGDEIYGYPKTIPSLKVGKFTVENVECVVLESLAAEAEPLLGMSFLGNFKFEINSSEKSLSLMRLEETTGKR
ncbi:MAG: retroviral-like aspartic protease family protein [Planctomycetaceae bacterium]|nr:retroviral-like aspartic protease family protein [Planctomycetaceae bacterium]